MTLLKELNERAKEEDASRGLEQFVNGKNWPTAPDEARVFAKQATSKFKFKEKIPKFNAQLDKMTTVAKMQQLVINAIMAGEGKGVLK